MEHSKSNAILVIASAVVLALLLGFVGAIIGAQAQVLLVMVVLAGIVLLFNQPLGLVLFILLVPYNGSQTIPRLAQNAVFFGVVAIFFSRMALRMAAGKPFDLPVPREIIVYVLLVTGSVAWGAAHLNEITFSFKMRANLGDYGLKEYVLGLYVKQMTLVVMAGIIAWLTVRNRGRSQWIIGTALFSGVLFVAMMFVVLGAGGLSFDQIRTNRMIFIPLGRQSNSAGAMLAIIFTCSLFMWEMTRKRGLKVLLFFVNLLLMMGVLLTASRAAILALMVALLIYTIEFRRLRTLFAAVTILAIGFALAPDAVHDRMLQGLDSRYSFGTSVQGPGDEVTSGRVDIWRQLAPEVARSPVIGRGLFSTQWSRYAGFGGYWANHPHNMFLGILMDVGIVGAVILFIFYRFVWRTFRSLGKDERLSPHVRGYFLGASAALVGYLVSGMANGYWHPSPDQVFLWVAIGLGVGYRAYLTLHAPAPVIVRAPKRPVGGRIPAYQRT
jgi:O-antigen ligase